MKILLTLSLVFITFLSPGQNLDLKAIREQTTEGAEYYKLKERFLRHDTLELSEYQSLYYGSLFQNTYQPIQIAALEARIRQNNFTGNYYQAISLADSLLSHYPVSIQALFERSFASHMLGDDYEASLYRFKYKNLIKGILEGNNGRTQETAILILSETDEYELLKYLDLKIKKQYQLSHQGRIYNMYDLKKNAKKIKTIYFDISSYSR
ncbi:MAG: DUF4919 domain-containing protein [Cytophagaceae bacterium]